MNDIPEVEDLFQLNSFLYDTDFVDGELIGELAPRGSQKMITVPSSGVTSQQSYFLRQQHQRFIPSFLKQYLWHVIFKDW